MALYNILLSENTTLQKRTPIELTRITILSGLSNGTIALVAGDQGHAR